MPTAIGDNPLIDYNLAVVLVVTFTLTNLFGKQSYYRHRRRIYLARNDGGVTQSLRLSRHSLYSFLQR